MPYREKIAWLSLLAIALTYGPYFALVLTDPPGPVPDLEQLKRFGITAVAQMVLLLGGRLALRLHSPEDAREPADERDRAIEVRSQRIAYFVLMSGAVWGGVVLPFFASGWTIVNHVLAAVVISEVTAYGIAVHSYRHT